MPSSRAPRVAVAPNDAPAWMLEAVTAGGGQVVDVADAQALVWASPTDGTALGKLLADAPHIDWVQLPWAGVEDFLELLDEERTWTCAKGVYAEPVAELALTLALAGMRGLGVYSRASKWEAPRGTNLTGADITIFGGGGIAQSFIRMVTPFEPNITVVRTHVEPMEGVDLVIAADDYHHALHDADLVLLALALTPETTGLISADELALMKDTAWIVNVARGKHIVTDDLVAALRKGRIGGAGLDVTDPEPLPHRHPLWTLPNCLITPHVGNTPEMKQPLLSARITANVKRYAHNEELLGLIDVELGY